MGEGILVSSSMLAHHRMPATQAALRCALTGQATSTGGEGLDGDQAV